MKTDELVALLARGPVAADAHAPEKRLFAATAAASLLALGAMLAALGLRADLSTAVALPMFWLKLLVPAAIGGAAFVACARLSRPGARPAVPWVAIVAALAMVWIASMVDIAMTPPADRHALVFGQSAWLCVLSVSALSLPMLAGGFVTLRLLAPTRPVLAGLAAGTLAGGMAATVYALHCSEMALPFLGTWYVIGMAVPALAGALLGPRLLRWP